MSQPPNLTRVQAAERSAVLRTDSYLIELDLTDGAGRPGDRTFQTRSTLRFGARPGSSTFVDFVGESVMSAKLNGIAVDVSGWTTEGGLPLHGLAESNELVVAAVGLYTNTGEGLHRFDDPEDGAVYLYTQFETADAKRLYACFDQPDLKARFTFSVTTPADWRVVSNGATESVSEGPGHSRVHAFIETAPMSTYVTALIAGPYHAVTDRHDGIDLGIYCRSSLAQYLDADRLFRETKQGFDFYHSAFGVRYPFGKYDQLFVPEFNAGAMENAGAVTFREEYVFRSRVTRYLYERRCETLLHEMAHMWFGDLVTMRWWDDLWLNESFATWASVVAQVAATEYDTGWTTFANVEKSWAYVQDQLPSTHPIAADAADLAAVKANFDGITYAKGASVLKQLAAYVGYDDFLAGLRSYFADHAFGNATLTDLLGALAVASGRDLTAWSAAWLCTTGINQLTADFDVDERGAFTRFAVLQQGATPGAGELRPHRLAIGIYGGAPGQLTRTHRVELDVTDSRTEVPDLLGVPRGAMVLVNDDDLTYCKMQLDPGSLAVAIDRIGDITESLPRTLVWSSVWEMTRDATLPAREFVALALRGVVAEHEIGVVQRVLSQTHQALSSYADPGWARTDGWPLFAGRLVELASGAAPGSDAQLAYVNSLSAACLNPAQLATIRRWWDGSAPLPGLTVDVDLSWTLLGALVAHGAAGDAEIAAAAAADATASGERRAVQVGALRPAREAKRAIWDRLMRDDSMANALQDAALTGFAHPAQTEVLAEFVGPYFEEVGRMWSRRSVEVAQKIVVGLFPRWAVAEDTVLASAAWDTGDHPATLRRLVSEGRSGLERALRARSADAES